MVRSIIYRRIYGMCRDEESTIATNSEGISKYPKFTGFKRRKKKKKRLNYVRGVTSGDLRNRRDRRRTKNLEKYYSVNTPAGISYIIYMKKPSKTDFLLYVYLLRG